jgi:hypothetical protein
VAVKTKPEKWIQQALKNHKPGTLHRELRVPLGQKLPLPLLRKASKAPGKLGRRARLALTLRGFSEKRAAKIRAQKARRGS